MPLAGLARHTFSEKATDRTALTEGQSQRKCSTRIQETLLLFLVPAYLLERSN